MKTLLIILAFLTISITSCKKNQSGRDNNRVTCTTVTITNSAPSCMGWGIIVNRIKYPSRNIPLQYQQNNLVVCATYVLYEDPAMCPCCGGTYADIKSMQ